MLDAKKWIEEIMKDLLGKFFALEICGVVCGAVNYESWRLAQILVRNFEIFWNVQFW